MCVCVCKIVAENESKTNFKWELTSLNRIVKKYFTSSFTFYLHSSLFYFFKQRFCFCLYSHFTLFDLFKFSHSVNNNSNSNRKRKEKKVPYQFIDEISNLEARVMPTLHDFAT